MLKIMAGKRGQHLTEFLMLFVALSVVFIGMKMYIRRGVDAKLKDVELQLNEQVGPPRNINIPAIKDRSLVWCAKKYNINGQLLYDYGCDIRGILSTANYHFLGCWQSIWWNKGCRLYISRADMCDKLGICLPAAASNQMLFLSIYFNPWPDGQTGWRELGVCVDRSGCDECWSHPSCCSTCPLAEGECSRCPATPPD